MTSHGGCSLIYKLGEGNFKILVICFAMILYIFIGAVIFQVVEEEAELSQRANYELKMESFMQKYPTINHSDLLSLLDCHADATMRGHLPDSRRRWDFVGSFYFVCTLVSTIGFGMTTPATMTGRIVCIIYGFLGCAGSILTFNSFLERIIVLWTLILRSLKRLVDKIKRLCSPNVVEMESGIKNNDEEWKPTIAKLLVVLSLTVIVISSSMSAVYMYVEDWSYLDSLYFCFITFTTTGFGDYVTHQKLDYPFKKTVAYSICNGLIIFLGCACMYSLLNIMSILFKESLTHLIHFTNRRCRRCYYDPNIDKVAAQGRRKQANFVSFQQPGPIISTIDDGMNDLIQNGKLIGLSVSSRRSRHSTYQDNEQVTTEETTADSNYDTASNHSEFVYNVQPFPDSPHRPHSIRSQQPGSNFISPAISRVGLGSDIGAHSQQSLVQEMNTGRRRALVRLESYHSIDMGMSGGSIDLGLTLARRSALKRRMSRPKSIYVNKRQVGSMNVIERTLNHLGTGKTSTSSESEDSEDDDP